MWRGLKAAALCFQGRAAGPVYTLRANLAERRGSGSFTFVCQHGCTCWTMKNRHQSEKDKFWFGLLGFRVSGVIPMIDIDIPENMSFVEKQTFE